MEPEMRYDRRNIIKWAGTLGVSALGLLASSRMAWAEWNKAAFDGKTLPEAYKVLGAGAPAESSDIQVLASDIAENGAVVPIQAVSKIANTQQIAIMVEKNPNMLAALFDISPDMLADVTTRIKMGQTSNVIVMVKADGKFYTATKEIKVTLGGCGG